MVDTNIMASQPTVPPFLDMGVNPKIGGFYPPHHGFIMDYLVARWDFQTKSQ